MKKNVNEEVVEEVKESVEEMDAGEAALENDISEEDYADMSDINEDNSVDNASEDSGADNLETEKDEDSELNKFAKIISEKAKEVKAVVKPAVKTVAKKVEEASEAVKPVAKSATKKVAKKAEEVTKSVKSTTKKTVKKVMTKAGAIDTEINIQYQGNEINAEVLKERAVAQYVEAGHSEAEIKQIKLYVKPEDMAAYYVINDSSAGKIDLF